MRTLAALLLMLLATTVVAGEWVGAPAPVVRLADQDGKPFDLATLRGKWVALYFYPKDNTPGCTEEAKQFRDRHADLVAKNVAVVGVSIDDPASHKAFAQKLGLQFTLLSDTDGSVSKAFGVLHGFGPLKFAGRETFLVDPEGTIVYHYPEVDTRQHAAQVLRDVEKLQAR